MATDSGSSAAVPAGGGVCGPEVGAAPAARSPRRRGDSGLTTLEWLLIVAAVAGLAALAVVLVQNVVSDTSEQIAGSSARRTAAVIAADQIMINAMANDQPETVSDYADWKNHWTNRCNRLNITYGDAGISAEPDFDYGNDGTDSFPQSTVTITKGNADSQVATPIAKVAVDTTNAWAECKIT